MYVVGVCGLLGLRCFWGWLRWVCFAGFVGWGLFAGDGGLCYLGLVSFPLGLVVVVVVFVVLRSFYGMVLLVFGFCC